MTYELYGKLQEIIYQSTVFRDFIINTNPFWQATCHIMGWLSPLLMSIFVRPKCLVPLLGGMNLTFFMYLEMTASCFVLHNYCNSEDDAISIYYWLFFGTIYSTIVLFIVGLTIATIQEHKQRK
jgi:hypothetical protein